MSTYGTIPVVFGKILAPPPPAGSPLEYEREKMRDTRVEEGDAVICNESLVDVFVGFVKFSVHRSLLCSRSEFAKSRLKIIDLRQPIHLHDERPGDFRRYLNLIYANQLATKGLGEWQKLCRLYVLAEKLQDLAAKNTIIDGMHTFLYELVSNTSWNVDAPKMLPAKATKELYDGTMIGCQVRKLIVDVYADCGHESWLREGREQLPLDLVYDVAARLMQQRSATVYGSSINRPASWYHEKITVCEKQAFIFTPPQTPPRATSNKTDTDTAKRSVVKPKPELRTPKRSHVLPVTPPPSTGKTWVTGEDTIPKLETLSIRSTTPTKEPVRTPRSSIFDVMWKKAESNAPGEEFSRTKPPAPSVEDADDLVS